MSPLGLVLKSDIGFCLIFIPNKRVWKIEKCKVTLYVFDFKDGNGFSVQLDVEF